MMNRLEAPHGVLSRFFRARSFCRCSQACAWGSGDAVGAQLLGTHSQYTCLYMDVYSIFW